MFPLKRHVNIALAYFLLVGLLGLFLRLFFVTPLSANFRYIVHAHSHIALLGWVYLGLTTLIYRMYFRSTAKAKTYRIIFIFTNVTLLGMLFTFPFQGYALFSITFSTLFLFASYFFAGFVFKNIPVHYKDTFSYRCIKVALWYLVISSIGPWAIGAVMATLGSTSIWYKLSIYFYLHFQYNAWFILALLGVFFYVLEKKQLVFPEKDLNIFFNLLNSGLILTLFLSALWVDPPLIVYVLGGIGALLQLWAFVKFFLIIKKKWKAIELSLSPFLRSLLSLVAVFLAVKIILQLLTAVPFFAELSYQFTDFVIGYLHWVFLGVVSIALFAFLHHFKLLLLPKPVLWIYLIGFVLSEALIFYKGAALWLGWPFFASHPKILLGVSALLPLAVYILLVNNYVNPEKEKVK